jgi:hypothetical protein
MRTDEGEAGEPGTQPVGRLAWPNSDDRARQGKVQIGRPKSNSARPASMTARLYGHLARTGST